MSKYLLKLLFFISFLWMNNAIAATNKSVAMGYDNLTIQIGNLSLASSLPRHDFAYSMTIPSGEIFPGSTNQGALYYGGGSDISTVFSRYDESNIEVDLKITDPAIGGTLIWQGKITYDKGFNKVVVVRESPDNFHYIVHINTIQPDQGRPQFIIGVICN